MAKRPTTDDDKTTPFIRDDEPAPKLARPLGAPAPAPAVVISDLAAVGGTPIVPKKLIVGTSFNNAKMGGGMPRWGVVVITVVVLLHVGFIGGSWASSIWSIERLDRPKGASFDIAIAPAPPPPPPPPPGGQKPQTEIKVKPKKTVKEVVQLTKVEKQERAPELVGSSDGVVGGEAGGVSDGVVGGDVTAPPPPPPPPPPPAPPQNVPPTLLESQRISGDKMIVPNDVTKTEIQRSGKDKLVGSFKICLTVDGTISTITQLKSTGFAAYDAKITNEIRSNWRYKPFLVNGRAAPVCTAVTFIYTQK